MSAQELRHNKILFLDLELLCWPDKIIPPLQQQHIIQIGLVQVDAVDLQITQRRGWYVRPNYKDYEVSEYCTNLTGITADILKEQGKPLPEVLNSIKKVMSPRNCVTYCWGEDNKPIQEHCQQYGIENPWEQTSIWDFGVFFRSAMNIKHRLPLANALEKLNLPFPGTAHDAVNDAAAVAALHIEMMKKIRGTK